MKRLLFRVARLYLKVFHNCVVIQDPNIVGGRSIDDGKVAVPRIEVIRVKDSDQGALDDVAPAVEPEPWYVVQNRPLRKRVAHFNPLVPSPVGNNPKIHVDVRLVEQWGRLYAAYGIDGLVPGFKERHLKNLGQPSMPGQTKSHKAAEVVA